MDQGLNQTPPERELIHYEVYNLLLATTPLFSGTCERSRAHPIAFHDGDLTGCPSAV